MLSRRVDVSLPQDVEPQRGLPVQADIGQISQIAGALPFAIAPAMAPAILAIGGGSYGVLYGFAGISAIVGAAAILPVKRVR